MIPKSIHDISLDYLKRTLRNARESKTLEFKRMMPAKGDKEVIQFLSAVTAFANTAGGDLVIGVDSDDGIATNIAGIPLAGYDAYKLHLEQLLAGNVELRLPPVAFHLSSAATETMSSSSAFRKVGKRLTALTRTTNFTADIPLANIRST